MNTLHRRFNYRTLDELRAECEQLNVDITFEEKLDAVWKSIAIGDRRIGNSLGIHPMEGCDGTLDGTPGELTFRRWRRFGEGGAKLIWGEATAVVPEGKANPRQLFLNQANASVFERLLAETRAAHRERFGSDGDLLVGLQLTHSGRWSFPMPVLAMHHHVLDRCTFADRAAGRLVTDAYPVISDDELEELEARYVASALLARDVGFDFIDLKQCHTYLLNELLAARNRRGRYGGSFENRTRFIRNVLTRIRESVGDSILLASRINVYDGVPYRRREDDGVGEAAACPVPYDGGFGVDREYPLRAELTEPMELVALLRAHGVALVNVSMGSPYFNPHIGRPYDRPNEGSYIAPEHPLIGVERHFRLTEVLQERFPDLALVGTGYSWLQRYFINAAESNLQRKRVTVVAVGRGAIAYPEFARDALRDGLLDRKRVCLAVSFCTDLMRSKSDPTGQTPSGCVPRDEVYADIFKSIHSMNQKEEQS